MIELSTAVLLGISACAAAGAAALTWRERQRAQRLQASLDQAHSRIDEAAGQDGLTGLLLRPAFDRELAAQAVQADRDRGALCLLYVGLDGLRAVNATHGRDAGDGVLREAAGRLRKVLGADTALARVGGDEFVALVPGRLEAARARADALMAAVAQRIDMPAGAVQMSLSIGIAQYPDHGGWARLIGHAETAMLQVKRAGGAARADYDPVAAADTRAQIEMANDLRQAIQRGELVLYYQPKVDAASLKITAAEALLRWRHPVQGLISPGVFIPLAERHGLIGPLGDWVVAEATRQAGLWRQRGLRMRVAINVSAYQMRHEDFVDRLAQALKRNSLSPQRFTCEITESVAMEDTAATVAAFQRLGALGLHVSIDDFGTGYSSLASLRRLPAQELKIDRAFVTDLPTSEDARSIASAIVQMAHTLGLRVVAEGVETTEQCERLVAMGCDELQGFLFAKPMTADVLELWANDDDSPAALGFRDSLFSDTKPAPLS